MLRVEGERGELSVPDRRVDGGVGGRKGGGMETERVRRRRIEIEYLLAAAS